MSRMFKSRDRVVILDKTYWGPLSSSNVYKRKDSNGNKRKYWYVRRYEEIYEGEVVVVDYNEDSKGGDYFKEGDLELYKDPNVMDKFSSELFDL